MRIIPIEAADTSDTVMKRIIDRQSGKSFHIQRGNPDSWRPLLTRMIPQLYGLFLSRGIHPELAEELTQKTIFDSVRACSTYDKSRGTPEQWIFGIGKNNAALEMRRRLERPECDGQLLAYIEAMETDPLPDEILEKKETAVLVNKALSELDEKEQIVLRSKYMYDLSARQIGQRLKMTEKAVHSLLYRARMSLRKKITELAPLFQEA